MSQKRNQKKKNDYSANNRNNGDRGDSVLPWNLSLGEI